MPKSKPLPTQQELHELFDYSVVTGQLYWKENRNSRAKKGHSVGCRNPKGYVVAPVNGRQYLTHRLVWMWVTGEDPGTLEVEHKNNQRDCNAWHNLRLATRSQNNCNKYVDYSPQFLYGKWRAKIGVNGKQVVIGTFSTKLEAQAAYREASLKYHGEFSSYSDE